MAGSRKNASYNGRLTNFASGLSQDITRNGLANFLAPPVVTGVSVGQYKKYDDKNAFQIYDTSRAIGGPATRIKFEATDPTYNCLPQALEITVDRAEEDAAGDESRAQQVLEESKIRTLVTNSALSHEVKVVTKIKAAVAATGGVGAWSNDANDPVKEVDALIREIAIQTGQMPNRIAFGLLAWERFRNNAKVIARQPGAALIGLTTGQAAAMFLNPSIDIRVGVLSYDLKKFGAAADKKNVIGDDVYIFLGSQNPDIYDPSFAKTFMTRNGSVDQVLTYQEGPRITVHAVDWSEDIQVVSTIAGKRITTS
jgi:hypothetical protein